ncbi:MAG TPA: hypothetical protein VIC87_10820 [Vicinamibacteria bacterium]|jgi:hypothetical protein
MQTREGNPGRGERRAQNWDRADWRAAEHGRYQVDRSYGEDWSITRGQVYEGEGAERENSVQTG